MGVIRRFWNRIDDWLMKPDPDDYVVNRYVKGYAKDEDDMRDILKKGDRVRAVYEGRAVNAVVTVASPNGRSLIIVWDDECMLGGHIGTMPVFREQNGRYASLMEGLPITLERREQ